MSDKPHPLYDCPRTRAAMQWINDEVRDFFVYPQTMAELERELSEAKARLTEKQKQLDRERSALANAQLSWANAINESNTLRSQLQAATARAEEAEKEDDYWFRVAREYRRTLLDLQVYAGESRKALKYIADSASTPIDIESVALKALSYQPEFGLIEEVRDFIEDVMQLRSTPFITKEIASALLTRLGGSK